MNVDVAYLPGELSRLKLAGSTVVVFDVLRATTTITAALAAGVRELHVYGSTEAARSGAASISTSPDILLCGEEQCLPPAGFDLGNSPGAFEATRHEGRSVCMSTTNATTAILAARGAAGRILAGALVNASAVANAVKEIGTDVILLGAGTNGAIAAEDVIGAGAVLHALRPLAKIRPQSDACWMSEDLFVAHRSDLARALRTARGGQNVIAAGLEADVDFAARLDVLDVVGEVHPGEPPVIRRFA
jgi:2-phosphosulfolactate phosphatase